MKNLLIPCTVAVLLSACGGGGGGGGGDGGGATATAPSAPVNKLAGYVGTWASDCYDHYVSTVTITSPVNNTLTLSTRTDFYAAANCTGAIVATLTDGADVTETYVDTVDSSIIFTPGAATTPARVDKVLASSPQFSRSITGTAVSHVVIGGQAQWCIDYGGGNQTCVPDYGTYPAQSDLPGALYVQGNVLYGLYPSGPLYLATGRLTKK
jgi:hypothetical protein